MQEFPSLQLGAAPPTHAPPLQVSPVVQALLSVHAALLFAVAHPWVGEQLSSVQGLPSLQPLGEPGLHAPPEHESLTVHALLSLQLFEFITYVHPEPAEQPSVVQVLPSLQLGAAPPTHAPPLQVSLVVQALLSLQDNVFAVLTQPLDGLQLSSVQGLPSLHTLAAPGTHAPLAQMSLTVQALLSLHARIFAANTQPLPLSQLSLVHGLLSLQVTAGPATHAPALQMSPLVHALLSLQVLVLLAIVQPSAGLQLSSVQGLPSLHTLAAPGTHAPLAQMSLTVQALLSLQGEVFGVKTQPLLASQLSLVHGLLSLQTTLAPATQVPPAHASPLVQALPSLHGAVLLLATQPVAESQVSVVQRLPSSHSLGPLGLQVPLSQVSPTVHALLSVHVALLSACWHPALLSQPSSVHGLPSLHACAGPDAHAPPAQVSPTLQTSPSLHGSVLSPCEQPSLAEQPSVVQGLLSLHATGAPLVQAPSMHTSPEVQASLSSQVALLALVVHPWLGSHLSSVQGLPSLQVTAAPATQLPCWHTSPLVHALPSLQPRALGMAMQPLVASHKSAVHGLLSSQLAGPPALQPPSLHTSPLVHALLSVHVTELFKKTQACLVSQLSSVHGLPSLQASGAPPWHAPPLQTSTWVQTLPSLQGSSLLLKIQPISASQLSVVHGLLSSQLVTELPKHTEFWQLSPLVHALPSSHAVPSRLVAVQPVAGKQPSLVHGLLSWQTAAVPKHLPLLQVSPNVQASLSSQLPTLADDWHAPAMQLSHVHGSPSSHMPLAGSSTRPSQSSSSVLHVSVVATLAEQAPRPEGPQLRLPLHVPRPLAVLQSVVRPRFTARGLQPHPKSVRTHCGDLAPLMLTVGWQV